MVSGPYTIEKTISLSSWSLNCNSFSRRVFHTQRAMVSGQNGPHLLKEVDWPRQPFVVRSTHYSVILSPVFVWALQRVTVVHSTTINITYCDDLILHNPI
jgi:hypothetical protein